MKTTIFILLLLVAMLIGEIRCIIKFVRCDFDPPYKKELIYGISMCCGAGVVVGYLNIEDK